MSANGKIRATVPPLGYLSHILLALAAVLAADAGLESGWQAPWALLGLVPLPHLLGGWIRNRSMLGKFREVATGTRVLTFSPVLLQWVAVCLFGWGQQVQSWLGADTSSTDTPEIAILFSLAPFVLFEFIAIDARSRQFALLAADIARLRAYQCRMFLSGLVPLTLFMVLASTLSLNPNLRAYVEEIPLFYAFFAVSSIGIFALSFPAILRNTWETVPMTDGVAHSVLTEVAERANFECKRLLVWKTGHQVSNAAIIGFLRKQRTVLFSDSLLAEMQPRELAAVFAHEIGHARRRHVQIFAAWTMAFFMFAHLAFAEFGAKEGWLLLVEEVGLVAIWYLGLGYLSRRFELDADLESLAITEDGEALISALEHVSAGQSRTKTGWRHFSTDQRVIFLRAQMRDPEVGRRLRQTLRLWSRTGVALFVLALIAELFAMGSGWNEGWIAAELRLGHYSSALERIDDGETKPELQELIRRAAGEADDAGTISTAELTDRARQALRQHDIAGAGAWLELAARRGLRSASDALQQLRRDLLAASEEREAFAAMDALAETLSP